MIGAFITLGITGLFILALNFLIAWIQRQRAADAEWLNIFRGSGVDPNWNAPHRAYISDRVFVSRSTCGCRHR
jgi:hypothetical protein